jgi:hypothetical protein
MYISVKNTLASLIVLLTIISVNQWSIFPIGNTYTNWLIYLIITILFLNGIKNYFDIKNSSNLIFVKLYLFWIIICSIRGVFEAECYWDFKSLIGSSFGLFIVVSIFIFTNPAVIQIILSKWLFYALPLFILFAFFLTTDSFGFYLMPITFFILFFPFLDNKWKFVIALVSFFVVFIDLDARSNVIKFLTPVVLTLFFKYKRIFNLKVIKILFLFGFIMPFVFLFLGLTNLFNLFQIDKYVKGTYTERKLISGQIEEVNLKADTRTFLYKEVIVSALKNKYLFLGRSPARGNESDSFGIFAAEELKTGRYERYSNEVSVLNIFTWMGLIGLILYFLVFLKSAYLAIYQSNSYFLCIIGLYITFRWIFAWIEDFNRFDIMNVILWIFISMGYSEHFRKMSDDDFKKWLSSIFIKKSFFTKRSI